MLGKEAGRVEKSDDELKPSKVHHYKNRQEYEKIPGNFN